MSETIETRTIETRIQNKFDTASNWAENNPKLYTGEIGYESDTGKFKIGDGINYWNDLPYAAAQSISGASLDETNEKVTNLHTSLANIELLDSKIKLEANLYTNYNIGRIKGATESNPVLIGEKDWTIREMFENIFRAQAEIPTVTLPRLSLSLSNNSADIEYGKEVTFLATINTSTGRLNSSYYSGGYTTSTGVTWGNLNLVSTNSTFDSKTSGITSGVKFNIATSTKYYAVENGGTIKGKATAPNGYISNETTAKNNLGNDTDIKISSDTSTKESSEASTSVVAGYVPYSYILATSALNAGDTLPSTRSKQAYTNIPVNNGDGTTKLYIYIPSNKTITEINNNKQAAPFSCDSDNLSLVVNNGKTTTFKVYHVNANIASGSNAFTITYA